MALWNRNKTVQGSSSGPEVPVSRNIVRVHFTKDGHSGVHDFVMDKDNTNQMTVLSAIRQEYGNRTRINNSQIIGETNG